jgi:hypothetical protein
MSTTAMIPLILSDDDDDVADVAWQMLVVAQRLGVPVTATYDGITIIVAPRATFSLNRADVRTLFQWAKDNGETVIEV